MKKIGIFSTAQKYFKVTQIDLEMHILCRTAR